MIFEQEELLVPTQAPVVALCRLVQAREVGVQLRAAFEGCGVDPLQHRAALVVPPVRARDAQQLDPVGTDLVRASHVRADAEVLEGVAPVERERELTSRIHGLAVGIERSRLEPVDELELVGLIGGEPINPF